MAKMLEKKYVTRSISLPVQECLSGSWADLERLMCDCWHHATCLANWAAHTLRSYDVVRTPGMTELPPLSKVDLYALAFGRAKENVGREFFQCSKCKRKWHLSQTNNGLAPSHDKGKGPCEGVGLPTVRLARAVLPATDSLYEGSEFWNGAKVAATSLLRKIESKYRKERGKIVWRRERRTPEYLYPFPFPVHQQAWAPFLLDNGRPVVNIGLPGGRVSLRLDNGRDFTAAMRVFKQLVDGDVSQQELTLDAQSSRAHCRLVHAKRPGDEPARELRLMVRIAYRMEVPVEFGTGHTAIVTTGSEPFLRMEIPGEQQPFVLHAPWALQWVEDHRRFLDRFADDLKFEKRWPRAARKRRNRRQTRGCEKHDNRMKTFRQQTAHQFVAHAARRGCARIVYDDSDQSFAEEFPWFMLAKAFQDKCDEFGIVFTAASGTMVKPSSDEKLAEV
jgi:hypothetical protein